MKIRNANPSLLQYLPVRCLIIYSTIAFSDPNKCYDIFQQSRQLFERGDPSFIEFFYFANHSCYENLQLSKIFQILAPCLGQLGCLGFRLPGNYTERFFDDLQWVQMPNLRQLHLNKIKLLAAGIGVLVKGFDYFPNLELLHLYQCFMDVVKNAEEMPGSYALAENLPKLKKLYWFSATFNHISGDGIKKLANALGTMKPMKKICLEGNKTDGQIIEDSLFALKDLPHLRYVDFSIPFENLESVAKQTALKQHILRPFELPFVFPSINQLKFVCCVNQLKLESLLGEDNMEEAIRMGIKRIKPYCSVEFEKNFY